MAELIDLVDDDGAFLSMVEAAEAEAVAAFSGNTKRQKISTYAFSPAPALASSQLTVPEKGSYMAALQISTSASSPAPALASSQPKVFEEGSYMAALKGSRSSLWQQQDQNLGLKTSKSGTGDGGKSLGGNSTSSGDTCFKCGMSGHWARDCIASGEREAGRRVRGGASSGGEGGEVPEKGCPCGLGSCLVFTSSTAKNPGRKFYRCPLKLENGGCDFFEWCFTSSVSISDSGSTLNRLPSLSVPEFPCQCGAGSCLVRVAKTGINAGREFYRCPLYENVGSCGFFKWINDQESPRTQIALTSKRYESNDVSVRQQSAERMGLSCFKCGQGGHWARDCLKQSSTTNTDTGSGRLAPAATTTCFRCGMTGHWARDCPATSRN